MDQLKAYKMYNTQKGYEPLTGYGYFSAMSNIDALGEKKS